MPRFPETIAFFGCIGPLEILAAMLLHDGGYHVDLFLNAGG